MKIYTRFNLRYVYFITLLWSRLNCNSFFLFHSFHCICIFNELNDFNECGEWLTCYKSLIYYLQFSKRNSCASMAMQFVMMRFYFHTFQAEKKKKKYKTIKRFCDFIQLKYSFHSNICCCCFCLIDYIHFFSFFLFFWSTTKIR